jgi:UDP-glucose 4-epimerase
MIDRKILVTGGAGFIGSEVVRQLAAASNHVVVLDNLINGRRENLHDVIGDRVQLIVADIRDERTTAEVLREVEVVFHMACLGVRHSIHSPHENHAVNATATLQLLSASRAAGVQRFVYISSSEVYGTAHWVPMTEEHPTYPMTVYGASKLAGECYTRAFHRTYGYPTVVVRPFNTYGPCCHHEGDSGEVIPKFVLRSLANRPMVVFGDGTQTRDFTYVSDMAKGIISAGFSDLTVGETVNLGSGHEISIEHLAREVSAITNRSDASIHHDEPRPGDVLRLYADTTKAQRLLGFQTKVSLREGLLRLKNWYLGSGKSAEELLIQEKQRNWETTGIKTNV